MGIPPDRRRSRRLPASATVHNITVRGRLLDFSGLGIAVESRSAFRVGERYRLDVAAGTEARTVEGVVRWCRLRATRRNAAGDFEPVFVAGLELSNGLGLSTGATANRINQPPTGKDPPG